MYKRQDRTQVIQSLAEIQSQIAPQKTITGGTSVENMRTLTSTSSLNKQIMVSPRSFIRTPRQQQNQDGITTIVTVEKTTKKRKSNERIEDKKVGVKYHMIDTTTTDTTTTIGTKSQTEQSNCDNKNGEDSKQNHDVQKESIDPQQL